ncbi:MAG: hypothetical protein GY953_52655 [bacterium]|nr:hypothetical protein [bacterium]
MRSSSDIHKHMRAVDVTAFQNAAERYGAYILVRRTNTSALKYIGKLGFLPKRLDCKFKTADTDFSHAGVGRVLNVSGLVVNPLMDAEFAKAFGPKKFQVSSELWRRYSHQVVAELPTHDDAGNRNYVYFPGGKLYSVDSNRNSAFFGCVMFSSSSLASAASYIHADYDLYGIVPADNPAQNIAVRETRLGQPHSRGRLFFDVQHAVNRAMGVPMVLHGSQEKYTEDMDDQIDVFYPDGKTVMCCSGVPDIERLYQTEFRGRKMFSSSTQVRELHGNWVVPV